MKTAFHFEERPWSSDVKWVETERFLFQKASLIAELHHMRKGHIHPYFRLEKPYSWTFRLRFEKDNKASELNNWFHESVGEFLNEDQFLHKSHPHTVIVFDRFEEAYDFWDGYKPKLLLLCQFKNIDI